VATVATLVAAVLVAWNLGTRSLWLDEASSVEIAGGTWGHLWQRLATREANGGLYFLLLHGWLALGRDEATVRALSAVALVVAVPLTWRLGVRLVGSWAGAAGAMLLATQPFAVRFGQEARSYALALLCVVAASLALQRACERPTVARWGTWVVAVALAAYAHVLTLLAVVAEAVVVRRRIPMAAVVAAGALTAPMLWFVLIRDTGQIAWLGPPDRGQIAWVLWKLTGEAGWMGVAAYAAAAAVALRGGGIGVRLLLAWAVVPFVVLLAVSSAKPLFLDRYLLMVVPAVVLLAAAGIARLRPPLRTLAALAFVAMHLAGVVRASRTPSSEDWRGASAIVRAEARPGDAIACWVDFTCVAMDYYVAGPPIVWLAGALDDPAAVSAILAAHPRIFLLLSHVQVGAADRTATLARIEAALAGAYVLADTRELPGVTVRRYERPP
jgi:mannosyltransferase